MSVDKEELLRYSMELQRQNPGITKEELEKRLVEQFYSQSNDHAGQPKKSRLQNWREKLGKKQLKQGMGVVVLLFLLGFAFGYKEEPLIRVSQTWHQMTVQEEETQTIPITPEEKAVFSQKAKESIAKDGGAVFLGKLASDAMNDTDIVAVNIRMLETGADDPEASWQTVDNYVKHHKLVQECVLKNATITWAPDEITRYTRVKEMYTAADRQVEALYQAAQKKDIQGMKKAIQKIQKAYMLWSNKGGLDKVLHKEKTAG